MSDDTPKNTNTNDLLLFLTKWLGLFPYELYVLPGMFIAMITMFVYDSFDPIQLHLLPHWFAFSMGQYIKTHWKKRRPGCKVDETESEQATRKKKDQFLSRFDKCTTEKKLKKPIKSGEILSSIKSTISSAWSSPETFYDRDEIQSFFKKKDDQPWFQQRYSKDPGWAISQSHCHGKTAIQSFPSGHTLIAFSLSTSLIMYLYDPLVSQKDKRFLGIPFYQKGIRLTTIIIAIFVSIMISLHRVLHGYHGMEDVMVGMVVGSSIGFVSYHLSNRLRSMYRTHRSQRPPLGKPEKIMFDIVRYVGIFLCSIGLFVSVFYDIPRVNDLLH